MWRTALRPRWLALLAVVLLAVSGLSWLGRWQLDRAYQRGGAAERVSTDAAPVPLTDLLAPRTRFPAGAVDRRVVVQGRWEGDRQLLVRDRRQPATGETGSWVLTPLRLPDGSAVGVVRGFTADPPAPGTAGTGLPTGQVRVTGVLRPGEPAVDRPPGAGSGLGPGELVRMDPVELIERWPGALFTGYVVADPVVGPGLAQVPADAPTGPPALQNLSYALQWWLFAGFGLWLWWRLVRDDHLERIGARSAAGRVPGGAGPDDGAPAGPVGRGAGPGGRMGA